MEYRFECRNEIESLKADWERINRLSSEKGFYQLFEINELWLKSNPKTELLIYVCLHNEQVAGIIPLMKKPNLFWYSFFGNSMNNNELLTNLGVWDFDYANIIAYDEHRKEVIAAWLRYLEMNQQDWDVIHFLCVNRDWELSQLDTFLHSKEISINKSFSEIFILYLVDDFDKYLNTLGNHERICWRKYANLSRRDKSLKIYEDNTAQGLDAFIRIHQQRWNKRGMPGVFDSDTRAFYQLLSNTSYIHLLFLSFHGEVFGGICYFDYQGCRYFAHSAIDVDKRINSSVSTGCILLLSSIKDAYEKGLKRFDFQIGKEKYKYTYTNTVHEFCSFVIYNQSFDYQKMLQTDRKTNGRLQIAQLRKDWEKHRAFCLSVYQLPEKKRILIVAAHFMDEITGCGGLIQTCHNNGATCDVIFMTNGDDGCQLYPSKQLADIRIRESICAKKIIGNYTTYFFGVKEGFLSNDRQNCRKLGEIIDLSNYDHIFVPSEDTESNDHKVSYWLVQDLIKTHQNFSSDVYKYETMRTVVEPNVYLEISNTYQTKLDAISCYQSQLTGIDYVQMMDSKIKYSGYREIYQSLNTHLHQI